MNIVFKACNAANYKKGRTSPIKYIVIHYTAGNGDTAKNNADYYASAKIEASAHYFVDEGNIIYQSVKDKVKESEIKLNGLKAALTISLVPQVKESKILLKSLYKEMKTALSHKVDTDTQLLSARKREIEALSPLSVLKRGYSLVTDGEGRVVRDKNQVKEGERLNIRVENGTIRTIVQKENI